MPPRNPAATLYPDMDAWTDQRLDDLAASLRPLPAQVARLTEVAERNSEDMREMREEIRSMRQEMSAGFLSLQRQLTRIGWGLAFALAGAVAAAAVAAAL